LRSSRVARALLLCLWAAAATASPFVPALASGLAFVLLAVLVLAFLPAAGSGGDGIGTRGVWQSASRVAWAAGALIAIILCVQALALSDGIEAIATGMALAFVPGVAGLALAGVALAIAVRRPTRLEPAAGKSTSDASSVWLERLLFLLLVGWTAQAPRLGRRELPFEPRDWMLHEPSLLVVAGTALILMLLFGRAWRPLAPVALALGGTVAALAGLVQALLGMARASIALVTAGLESVTTACIVTLVVLALLSVPTLGPSRDDAQLEPGTPANVAYALFPLVSLLLLAVAVVMVLTPMQKPG